MALTMTYHGNLMGRDANGAPIPVLPPQRGDSIDIAGGAVSDPMAGGIYRVTCTAACVVRFDSADPADASNGEPWDTNMMGVPRYIPAGNKVAVDSA